MYKKRNEEYDSEPVVYCSKCYSLKIKHEDMEIHMLRGIMTLRLPISLSYL